jgi:PAS domain S-box-containing protein
MEWEPIVTLLELLGENPKLKVFVQVVSFVVVVVGLYRYIAKPSWAFHWKLFVAADQVIKTVPIVIKMAEDFKPNGGNSLRDVVNRIDRRQGSIEGKVSALLTTTPIAMFETDSNGSYTWVNRAWCDLTGFQFDEALGFGWLNIICSDYQAAITAQWRLAIEQKRDCILEFDLVTKSDHVRSARIETTPFKTNGEISGYIGRLTILAPTSTQP